MPELPEVETTRRGIAPLVEGQEVTEVIVDPERGTREKKYKDGRLEVWYSNGNRKEISSDGQTVKVSPASVMVASYHHHH